ncbi:MAG: bifunctional glutamate N-acetyltransferase/amino-acid acetyltransferase ArgJ [Deltaproteobacteria bacterium]|nr:MAG: bifunctional glutamate N-acetyltransferase/amino-acid acetyltransferase ArgJ [Deltaproteobacteria bacterium]TMA79144.1 MAG: bifunctional glutamate N-acetyltransferase/amino-acid acetyltransferase ArgJ [Deltaproteobacteria bacterium]
MKLARRAHRVRIAGFRFAGVRCGLKTRGPDVALVVAEPPAVAAGVFTTCRAPAAPVQLARRRLLGGRLSAVLVHAGNANACTGREGLRTASVATALVGRLLGVPDDEVAPCATGRIGVQVPRARLLRGVRVAAAALRPDGFPAAAQAITTTDAFPKTAVRRLRLGGRRVTVAAFGKGAGMIAPRMATLLVFVVTDASVSRGAARRSLTAAVEGTLNAISVDGDTSTNDTVLLLASGAAGNPRVAAGSGAHLRLTRAVTEVLEEIARLVVLDGEGTTRLVEILVRGARSATDARRVARAIGDSMLCKTAFHGGDPNWGRFVMAAGNAGVPIDQERVDVTIGGVAVARRGRPLPGALGKARARMRRREVRIVLDLHLGRGEGRIVAADLSLAYVRFNAEYTT